MNAKIKSSLLRNTDSSCSFTKCIVWNKFRLYDSATNKFEWSTYPLLLANVSWNSVVDLQKSFAPKLADEPRNVMLSLRNIHLQEARASYKPKLIILQLEMPSLVWVRVWHIIRWTRILTTNARYTKHQTKKSDEKRSAPPWKWNGGIIILQPKFWIRTIENP